jgi:5-methylcytosine-specific restriction endonuclease McrA
MACLRCGSDWVTKNGKDKVSCPECCKQQRAKARRLGRLPSTEHRTCQRCGAAFEAVGGNAIRHGKHCDQCKADARKEWVENYKDEIKAGVRTPQKKNTPSKRLDRTCDMCGKNLDSPNQRKYCSNKCFVDARKVGKQKWDRRGQLESVWHRGGKWAAAPSKKIIGEMENTFNKFVADMNSFRLIHEMQGFMHRSLYPRKSDVPCKTCGKMIGECSRAYCSVECWQQHEVEIPCRKCGSPAIARAGRKSVVCVACKKKSRSVMQRLQKQRYGRNHRQRARYHGVKYMAFPVRAIYERDGYKCQLCGKQVLPKATYRKRDGKIHPSSPTIDHIVPMCKGGNHEPANCQTACFICNSRKSGKGGGQTRLALT